MALTRKMLAAMDIPAEKIDEIISAHSETVNAIKTERDELKAAADKLPAVEKDLEKANAELETFRSGDWEKKYTDLKSEYEGFKTDTAKKAETVAKENAYKQLLLDAGISEKRVASVMKVSSLDEVKLDKDGKIEGADKLTENVKSEWADFIVTTGQQGAQTATPPENTGGDVSKPSRAAQLVAQYRNEHYGNAKED